MISKNELKSLVYLLDDPDTYIQTEVKKKLLELGENAVPLLDELKNETKNPEDREKIIEIIRTITYGNLEEDFLEILDNGLKNREQLENAVFILSRLDNPTIRVEQYKYKLDRFADMVDSRIRYRMDENKQMHTLLNFVFDELNFTGSTVDYYNPDNCFMNRVINRRQGLPISLALIVLFLARRLDLPFCGVNMPIHFMLTFKGEKEEILIDPFDKGKVVTYNQCYFFLKQNGIDPKAEHFETATDSEILARCIRNLVQSYSRMGNVRKVEELKKLLGTVEMMTQS